MNVINSDIYKHLRGRLHEVQKEITRLPSVWNCSRNLLDPRVLGGSRITTHPCRSPHACARCTPQFEGEKRKEIERAIHQALNESMSVVRMDLTIPYECGSSLGDRYSDLMRCWNSLTTSRRFKEYRQNFQLGYIRVLEETFGEQGWFPHFHVLFFSHPDHSAYEIHDQILVEWVRLAQVAGYPAKASSQSFDIINDKEMAKPTGWYLTKHGLFDLSFDSDNWQPSDGPVRPFLLLQAGIAQGDSDLIEHWNSFEISSKGKRRIVYSNSARKLLDI